MKLLAALFSLISLGYLLTTTNWQSQQTTNSNDQALNIANVSAARVDEKLLSIENDWLSAKQQRAESSKKPQQKVEKKQSNTLKQFALGDRAFTLYGIFNDPKQPFVLLKDEENKFIKLQKGELLTEQAKLVALSSNSIAFEQNNERVEFKLFERKK